MVSPFSVFVSGITGVFFGMGFLYISIRVTAWAVDRFSGAKEEEK